VVFGGGYLLLIGMEGYVYVIWLASPASYYVITSMEFHQQIKILDAIPEQDGYTSGLQLRYLSCCLCGWNTSNSRGFLAN
jgi:hypothetical protein